MARTQETTETVDAHTQKGSHNGRASHANGHPAEDDDRALQDRAVDALRMAPDAARQTASAVVDHAPEVLNASTSAISEATRRIQDSSDEQLTGWAAFALGLWVGLMLGRVPRFISVVAGLPALVLAGALVARRGGIGTVTNN
jgi:hypothetical protein